MRHSYQSWHQATDNLAGTDVYGVWNNYPDSVNSWSKQFNETLNDDGSTLFMFSNEDCTQWLITRNDQFTSTYTNEYKHIIASNYDLDYYVKWSNRGNGYPADPLISIQDYPNGLLYAENVTSLNQNTFINSSSVNVWIS